MPPTATEPDRHAGARRMAAASLILAILAAASLMVVVANLGVLEVAIVGILGVAPLAILLGCLALSRPGHEDVTLSVATLGVLCAIAAMISACALPAPVHQTQLSRRSQLINNMKQVALGLWNYEHSEGRLPPAIVRDPSGRPLYSWRVLILPYIEESALYNQFHLDEPWDSPHNRTLLARAPWVYRALSAGADPTLTHIQAITGPGTVFEDPAGQRPEPSGFPDGTDRTVLAIEAGRPVPWSAPMDLRIDALAPLPPLGGGFQHDRPLFRLHTPIPDYVVCFADGSVKVLQKANTTPEGLRALATRNGGETVPPGLIP